MSHPACPQDKILFISHSAAIGGAEMCLLNHLRYLDRERWSPLVVLPGEGPLRQQIDALGVRTMCLPMEWWIPSACWHGDDHFGALLRSLKGSVENLAGIIERESVTIVQTNAIVTIDGALAAARTGRPHVWHIHENLLESEMLQPYISAAATFTWVGLLADRVVAVSEFLGRRLRDHVGGEKLEIIRGGIPIGDYVVEPVGDHQTLRSKLDCDERTLLVGTVGSVAARKNPEGFVDVAAQVLAARPDVMFVWIGRVVERQAADAAMKKARDLKIKDRVRFIGFQPSIREALADLDVVIHPSLNESLSLVCIEAMAAGKPVVATRCGGPEEVVAEGETGFLVSGGDTESMAARVIALLDDGRLRAQLGGRGRLRAQDLFDTVRATRQFEQLYERLLAETRQPVRPQTAELISSLLQMLKRAGELANAVDRMPSMELLRLGTRRALRDLKRRLIPKVRHQKAPPAENGN